MGLFHWFRRRWEFDYAAKLKFATWIADTLSLQVALADESKIDLATPKGAKALGYVYGFVDASLRAAGHDMSDLSIGVPTTWHVLQRIFPGQEERYIDFIASWISTDTVMATGMMLGGQQCVDWLNRKRPAPMGLARCLLELEPSTED